MDIYKFLKITKNPYNIFTKDKHPKELASIYGLFNDISVHFKPAKSLHLELILIQSAEISKTQIIELDKHYIVLEMQQVSMFSQLMEELAFNEIDQNSDISLFHQLWIDAYNKRLEFISDSSKRTPICNSIKIKHKLNDSLLDKFRQSTLTANLVDKDEFASLFEIIIAFILIHEICHHYSIASKETDEYNQIIKSIKEMPNNLIESNYLKSWVALAPGGKITKHDEEELYCDFIAIKGAWSLCINRHYIDPSLFGFTISLMYNCMYFFALQDDVYSSSYYKGLKVRQAISLSHCLCLIDDVENINPVQYERFLVYIDIYSFNFILRYSKNNILNLDVHKYAESIDDILTLVLSNDDIPLSGIDKLSINYFLERAANKAEKISWSNL